MPPGGEKWLLKWIVIESFIKEIQKETLIHLVLKQWSIYEWVIEHQEES